MDRFLEFVPEGGSILDLGCGSGRDSSSFIDLGYYVTPMDGSKEMCSLASVHIGEDVLNITFSEMEFEDVFDGVWANASLLHVPSEEMPIILQKIVRSLKTEGVLYMSFRYGDFEGVEGDRYFNHYHTKKLKELISEFKNLELIEIRKTEDVRKDKDQEWIYGLIKKVDIIKE